MISNPLDDAKTIVTRKLSIEDDEVTTYNDFLNNYNVAYELVKDVVELYAYAIRLYSNGVIFEKLTTCLEMLFLKENDQKKVPLAKRVSVFLGNSSQEIIDLYNTMIGFYEYRSDSTHEGKASNITETDIISLRNIVRKSIVKVIHELDIALSSSNTTFQDYKSNLIQSLKDDIANKNSHNFFD